MITARDLTIEIGGKTICQQFHFAIEPGQAWVVLGQNGSGKTTLLHTLAGLRPPQHGNIQLCTQDIATLPAKNIARKIGILLQDTHDFFPSTVLESCLAGRHPYLNQWQWESAEDFALAQQALRIMHLDQYQQRSVLHLSGGERRRLALATLITQSPLLYILDEPTNHLDIKHQMLVLNYFSQLVKQQRLASIMSLHDINLAKQFSTHALFLYPEGDIQQGTSTALFTAENLTRLYQYPCEKIRHTEKDIWLPQINE